MPNLTVTITIDSGEAAYLETLRRGQETAAEAAGKIILRYLHRAVLSEGKEAIERAAVGEKSAEVQGKIQRWLDKAKDTK